LRFLDRDDVLAELDLCFALRMCQENPECSKTALPTLYAMLGNHEEAVRVALASEDLDLAKAHAVKAKDKGEQRQLFLKIVEHEAAKLVRNKENTSEQEQEEQLLQFQGLLASHSQLISIRDLLPYVPESLVVGAFKNEIASYLEHCERAIDDLRQEMREHRKAAQLLKEDLKNVSNRTIELRMDAVCEFCGESILNRKFVTYPCGHAFHVDCCESLGLRIHEDCPICGYQMIDAVSKPFVYFETEAEEEESWKI